MQARKSTPLANNRIVLPALALSLLAGALAVALLLTGATPLSRGDNNAQTSQPAAVESVPVYSSNIGFDPGLTIAAPRDATSVQSWGLGVGFTSGFVSNSAASRHSWGLGVGFNEGLTSTSSANQMVRQLPGHGIGPTEH